MYINDKILSIISEVKQRSITRLVLENRIHHSIENSNIWKCTLMAKYYQLLVKSNKDQLQDWY